VLIRAGLHSHTAYASTLYRAAPYTTSSDYYVVTIKLLSAARQRFPAGRNSISTCAVFRRVRFAFSTRRRSTAARPSANAFAFCTATTSVPIMAAAIMLGVAIPGMVFALATFLIKGAWDNMKTEIRNVAEGRLRSNGGIDQKLVLPAFNFSRVAYAVPLRNAS